MSISPWRRPCSARTARPCFGLTHDWPPPRPIQRIVILKTQADRYGSVMLCAYDGQTSSASDPDSDSHYSEGDHIAETIAGDDDHVAHRGGDRHALGKLSDHWQLGVVAVDRRDRKHHKNVPVLLS